MLERVSKFTKPVFSDAVENSRLKRVFAAALELRLGKEI